MIRELSPELAKLAKKELNENPKQVPNDLQHLKDWIAKQPHLIARTDDQWLIALLRGCKFSLERVKKKLDLYYTLRTTAPDITLRIKPTDPKFIEFFRLGTVLILPSPKDKLFPRVILIRAGRFDPSTHSVADLMCMLYYLVQIMVVEDDVACVMGTKIVTDYEAVTMSHLVQATPSMLKKMVAVSQDSMPLRLKGSHHINLPSGIEKIFTLISGFLNEKAKQRLKIHKKQEEMMEDIPKEVVPPEYGGTGPTVAEITEYWVSKIKEYHDWMKVEERLGTDESKRVGPPIDADFMEDGSFRKLDID
ncbi:hypothetical protein PYW07_000940 [Mythimna separata]|uniref:CRAL-TRIO domain-containing protein n=1 Tax=Mythimna separata TaxID=271217 RepID=A0AAD7YRC8_MYTSE|nr:hypothetical protein PYW07_000940 [Mythimna separata]